MTEPDFGYLQKQINLFAENRNRISWVDDYQVTADKAVVFGLHREGQILALMDLLQVENLDAIAGDEAQHYQEESNIAKLQLELEFALQWMQTSPEVTEREIQWWNAEIPDFFKTRLLQRGFFVDFHHKNFSKYTGLKDNWYDLAFIDGLLDQVLYDTRMKNPEKIVRDIIREMGRIVRQDGFIAAYQFVRIGHRKILDFRRLFESENLHVLKIKQFIESTEQGRMVVGGILVQKR